MHHQLDSISRWTALALGLALAACTASSDDGAEAAANPGDGGGQSAGGAGGSGGEGSWAAYDAGFAPGGGGAGGGGGAAGDQSTPEPQPWQREGAGERFAHVDVGDGATLDLVRLRVTVQIEGLRARTTVDHVFHNPHARDLEGTFSYALPAESGVSYFGQFLGDGGDAPPPFFGPEDGLAEVPARELAALEPAALAEHADRAVWGAFRVGRVVPAERGRQAYEDITRRPVDPGLVEEVAPNTFSARVFPIRAGGYNRVILAYEQTLPRLPSGDLFYAIDLPEGALAEFELVIVGPEGLEDASEDASVRPLEGGGFHAAHLEFAPGGRYAARLPAAEGPVDVLAGTDPVLDEAYTLLRLHAPGIEGAGREARERGVFVLDTSWSAHPDRFAVDVALLQAILEGTPEITEFAVLTFDAGARWLTDGLQPNTPAARAAVMAQLDRVLLEGATDFEAALSALKKARFLDEATPVDVFVLTDGAITWGDADAERLVRRFEHEVGFDARFFAYRTGLGAENGALFAALTRRGATFNCLTADSVPGCGQAHTAPGVVLDEVSLVGVGETPARTEDLLVAGGQATLFPGAHLTVAARLDAPGTAELRLAGRRGAEPVTEVFPVTIALTGELAARAWGEIAVNQLLAARDEALDGVAVAIAQHFRIVSRVSSLLVLESDVDYALYDLDEARDVLGPDGVGAAVGLAFDRLGVDGTDFDGILAAMANGGPREALEASEVAARLRALAGRDRLDLPPVSVQVPLVLRDAVEAAYADGLDAAVPDPTALTAEGQRRYDAGQTGAALRALSTMVEVWPSQAEATRLVAYRLRTWGLDAPAARLLWDVLRRRPYEPQSYRDLADALAASRPAMAALLFEAALAGTWDGRFHRVTQLVAEEYGLFIAEYVERHPGDPLAEWLLGRVAALQLPDVAGDLRVTITWNTDNTDIDLWVTDPAGEKCYYGNRNTQAGGELLDDVTAGFGPERFRDVEADPGVYRVQVHYYGNNGNRLSAETHVRATVVRFGGTPHARVERFDVVLSTVDAVVDIADVVFE